MILLPDESQSEIYEKEIKPNLKDGAGAYLAFGHGFNIHYKKNYSFVKNECYDGCSKSPGHTVRSEFTKGGGIPDLIAVHQDASGDTKQVVLLMLAQLVEEELELLKLLSKMKLKQTYLVSKQFFVVEQRL